MGRRTQKVKELMTLAAKIKRLADQHSVHLFDRGPHSFLKVLKTGEKDHRRFLSNLAPSIKWQGETISAGVDFFIIRCFTEALRWLSMSVPANSSEHYEAHMLCRPAVRTREWFDGRRLDYLIALSIVIEMIRKEALTAELMDDILKMDESLNYNDDISKGPGGVIHGGAFQGL
tara:strand:+ start:115 stop:636 length:522 start_codon:yes stop_codon:yes gene_type:complete